ncbi:MAG: macro domain-containing protein [Longimicrobiales bacterium]|nr:macro domain-containing protein [Longimicrobiales bacterium]
MIHVHHGSIMDVEAEGFVRPIRTDLSPVSALSRDLGAWAGPDVEDQLARSGSLPLGGAVMTPGGQLPAAFLIHVVVMSEDEPQTSATVQKALRNGLRRATDWALESLALPPLGIGVGMTEPEVSARALTEILFNHLDEGAPPLELTIAVSSGFEEDLFRRLVEELTQDRA